MAQDKDNISHGWRDFFIGVVIMLVVIFLMFVLTNNQPPVIYPNSNTCNSAGC